VLPDRLGRDIDIREVRAVADLARAEEWDDIFSTVLARLQDKTPHHEVTSTESVTRIVSNKLAIVSPYLALIGLVGVVSAAVAFRRRKV
jgi:hypothetical protein